MKEKEVVKLQTELQKYTTQNPVDNKEAVCTSCLMSCKPLTRATRRSKPNGNGTVLNGMP